MYIKSPSTLKVHPQTSTAPINRKSSIGISFGNQACNRITYNNFHTFRPALRPQPAAWTEIGLDRRPDLVRLLDDQLWCRDWSHQNGTAATRPAGDWCLIYEQGRGQRLVSRDETKLLLECVAEEILL